MVATFGATSSHGKRITYGDPHGVEHPFATYLDVRRGFPGFWSHTHLSVTGKPPETGSRLRGGGVAVVRAQAGGDFLHQLLHACQQPRPDLEETREI